MLEGSFIEQSKGRWMQPVLLLLSVLFGWLICWKKMPIRLVVLLPALLSVLLVSSAWLLFDRWRIRIDVVLPLLGVGLQFGGALGLVLYRLRKSRQEISGLFGRYVSQNYVNLLIQKVSEGQGIDGLVAGDRREISVLFSDVRGFTSLSEATDPATVAQILRVYFTGMIRILREEYQATMDKLLGDGLMAFYNAPLPQQDHAARAVRSALAMLQAVAELDLDEILDVDQIGDLGSVGGQERYQLKIGIGINTGLAIIGDLGSETFADYTVLGDSVNLAARLEALNKIYGTSILISEYTYEAVKTEFTCRRVDHVRVKGRVEPVWIYEVMSLASQVTPGQQALCAAYEGALSARDSGDAQLAESELQRLVLRHPDDGPTAYMLSQIRAVQSDSTSS